MCVCVTGPEINRMYTYSHYDTYLSFSVCVIHNLFFRKFYIAMYKMKFVLEYILCQEKQILNLNRFSQSR